jgi:hypothetical protein
VEAPGSVRFDSDDPKSLVLTTARLVDEALGLLEHAKKADDRRTALAALREARDGLSLLMRVAGMLTDGATINVDARRQSLAVWANLSEDELRALASGHVTANRGLAAEPEAAVSAPSDAIDAVVRPLALVGPEALVDEPGTTGNA